MGYGYVLGLNDLRDLKEQPLYKKRDRDEYEDLYQDNLFFKNNRNIGIRKGQDEMEAITP